LIASSRYRIDSIPDHGPWPESADGFSEEIRAGVLHWSRMDDGSLRVELNLRQDDGPMVSTKQLLAAFGLEQERIPHVGVTREMLVLSAGRKRKKPVEDTAGAAV